MRLRFEGLQIWSDLSAGCNRTKCYQDLMMGRSWCGMCEGRVLGTSSASAYVLSVASSVDASKIASGLDTRSCKSTTHEPVMSSNHFSRWRVTSAASPRVETDRVCSGSIGSRLDLARVRRCLGGSRAQACCIFVRWSCVAAGTEDGFVKFFRLKAYNR